MYNKSVMFELCDYFAMEMNIWKLDKIALFTVKFE